MLHKVFESLIQQTNRAFIWMIIDDGSTDNTKELIDGFKKDAPFEIIYMHKINGGKHTALNIGIQNIDTKYMIILDSDDILTENAVEIISEKLRKYDIYSEIASIVFLKGYPNGELIGDCFPNDEFLSNHIECCVNLEIEGDKAEVFRTDILKKFPFPEIKNEKFIGEGIVWSRIGKQYSSVYCNEMIYIAGYLPDGLTNSGIKMRINNPVGGMLFANEHITDEYKITVRVKYALLFGVYGLFANKSMINLIKNCKAPFLFSICSPLSLLIYKYWKIKYSLQK